MLLGGNANYSELDRQEGNKMKENVNYHLPTVVFEHITSYGYSLSNCKWILKKQNW